MATRTFIAVAVLLGFSSPAAAQMATVEDYIKRVNAIDPKALSAGDCAAQVAKANILNAADLFYAAAVCHAVKKDTESSFLLSAGQVRGSADMAVMTPATKADLGAAAALYGYIYFYAGGPGNIDVCVHACLVTHSSICSILGRQPTALLLAGLEGRRSS